ncbi:MAG: hypothetical protein MRJ93_14150 [Nitrososphaeraceae archaeon]|nr:hypothetical protein [Nitrososphaeraceae archaeon]
MFHYKADFSNFLLLAAVFSLIIFTFYSLDNAYSINPTNPTDQTIKGAITSLTNENNLSKPSWILAGVFKIENVTSSPTFNSTFYMIKTDGTNKHIHSIYDFKLNGEPIVNPNNNSTVLNGTSTITMKDGPVKEVPTVISLLNDDGFTILVDPSKVSNHFGNWPIYGTQHLICVEIPSYCK